MDNVWDNADVLAMAIRLRKEDKCPRDVDDLFGSIVIGIVKMATLLMFSEGSVPACRREELLSEDVQGKLMLATLMACDKYVDTEVKSRRIVNYLVKTVQNRIRNHMRDTGKREERLTMLSESELGFDIQSAGNVARGLDGSFVQCDGSHKVNTSEKFN